MGKRKRENAVNLDSFLDILTCLQGVLMLIIITTGIDAAQTKIMVATPIELAGNERPIYIECRNDQLFLVPVAEARQAIQTRQLELLKVRRENTDVASVLQKVGESDVDIGTYVVDFTRYLSGQIALMPKRDAEGKDLVEGYALTNTDLETDEKWFGKIVANMDNENERLNFLVRDDSYDVFKRARFVAWAKKVKVTYQLVPPSEPLIF